MYRDCQEYNGYLIAQSLFFDGGFTIFRKQGGECVEVGFKTREQAQEYIDNGYAEPPQPTRHMSERDAFTFYVLGGDVYDVDPPATESTPALEPAPVDEGDTDEDCPF